MALISGSAIGDAIADRDNELTRLVGREADDARLIDELFLRILNRPPTDVEREVCRKNFAAVDRDHRHLAEAFGRAEMEAALNGPQQAREHAAALAAAKAELAAYERDNAAKIAEAGDAEGRRDGRARGRPEDLRDEHAGGQARRVGEGVDRLPCWVPIVPETMRAQQRARRSPNSPMGRSSSRAGTTTAWWRSRPRPIWPASPEFAWKCSRTTGSPARGPAAPRMATSCSASWRLPRHPRAIPGSPGRSRFRTRGPTSARAGSMP